MIPGLNILKKLFKTSNERKLVEIQPLVQKINSLEPEIQKLSDQELRKKTDGAKTKNIRGIANFIDANLSGGPQSKECILILCEGLSAMSGIVSGLSSEDRNTIGIYPLKGKLLNVRGEQTKKVS